MSPAMLPGEATIMLPSSRTPRAGLADCDAFTISTMSATLSTFSVINAFMFRDYPGVVERGRLAGVSIGRDTKWGRAEGGPAAQPDWNRQP